jgi:putative ABC transport system permease protein
VRAALARKADIPVSDVSFAALVDHVDSVSRAEWLATTLRAADPRVSLDGPRVLELLEWSERERRLRDVVGEEAPAEHAGLFGMSARNQWLLLLSFLVCVVGVANAMLMSVTERFTEIATMKCLGAMDRFVMLMFVFEAVIQGAVGGVVGALLGVALAVIRGLVEYGTLLGGAGGAFGEALLGVALSIAVGMLLAAVAAVGPAWLAARLAPMEAMRVD